MTGPWMMSRLSEPSLMSNERMLLLSCVVDLNCYVPDSKYCDVVIRLISLQRSFHDAT